MINPNRKWPLARPMTNRQLRNILETMDEHKPVTLEIYVQDSATGATIVRASADAFHINERKDKIVLWRGYGDGLNDSSTRTPKVEEQNRQHEITAYRVAKYLCHAGLIEVESMTETKSVVVTAIKAAEELSKGD